MVAEGMQKPGVQICSALEGLRTLLFLKGGET
jgi:hypothetical protein